MFFGVLLMLTSLVIAGVAGWFSVYGLAHIYQGAFISVLLMGGALEIGKLVATSFLYRYWSYTTWLLKTYLIVAILGLMLITSSGIFGYLSNAYQQDAVGIKDVTSRIELIDREYEELSKRELAIDAEVNAVDPKYVTARLKLMTQYKPEKDKITERRNAIRSEKLELSSKQLEVEAHTGPIIYIAKAMDKDVDTAVMWLSLLIIAVFDPLAVALTIAANAVFIRNKELKDAAAPPEEPTVVEKIVEVEKVVERIVKVPVEKIVEVPVDREVEVVKFVEVPREIPAGFELIDELDLRDLRKQAVEAERLESDLQNAEREAEEREEGLKELVRRHLSDFEELKTEKDRLVKELQEFLAETKDQGEATTRLEHSLQAQIAKLNKTVERTGLELDVALDSIEKRDARIEELEELTAELENQIVELRVMVKKTVDMTPTERAALHQQNIANSKNS
ncbi:hypothetical protein D3C75_508990 [compost metagenome]